MSCLGEGSCLGDEELSGNGVVAWEMSELFGRRELFARGRVVQARVCVWKRGAVCVWDRVCGRLGSCLGEGELSRMGRWSCVASM